MHLSCDHGLVKIRFNVKIKIKKFKFQFDDTNQFQQIKNLKNEKCKQLARHQKLRPWISIVGTAKG